MPVYATQGYAQRIIMKKQDRFRWLKITMLVITGCIVLFYLLACLVPFVAPTDFLPIALAGLAFPILFILYALLLVYWFFKWKKLAIILCLLFLLGGQQFMVMLGMRFFAADFSVEKKEGVIRILNWNVFRWDEQNKKARGGITNRLNMMDVAQMQEADVMCLQEFFEPYDYTYFESNLKELEKRGYPYQRFFASSSVVDGKYKYGMAIVSKYPIVTTDTIDFDKGVHSEGILWVDVRVNNTTIRVYSFHLESFRLGKQSIIARTDAGGTWGKTKNNAYKLKHAYGLREQQAELLTREVAKSPFPVVLCGNLGDVPTSYTYFKVRNKLNDAFLEKGSGLGRSFRFFAPTLRVDYVFTDKQFSVDQFHMPAVTYSDHYPQVVDVKLK